MAENNYYAFLDEMAEKLQAAQSPFTSQFKISIKDVNKANGMSYRGIEIADQQSGMGVTINMDQHYKMYLDGKSLDEIADMVQHQALNAFENKPDVDVNRVTITSRSVAMS